MSGIIYSDTHKRLVLMPRSSKIPVCEGVTKAVVVCELDLMDVMRNGDSTVTAQGINGVSTVCERSHADCDRWNSKIPVCDPITRVRRATHTGMNFRV